MGIKPGVELYKITWREYVLLLRAYYKKRSHEYEHTRAICYVTASVNRDSKKPFPRLHEWWPLPTDRIEEIDPSEGDKLKEIMKNTVARANRKIKEFDRREATNITPVSMAEILENISKESL